MKVRLAQLEDLSKIIAIEKICFPIAEAAAEKQFHERFESFGDCFLVAEDHGVVVGFINGCATSQPYLPDELYYDASLHISRGAYQTVFGLDVLPEYRQQGVARKLLNALIDLAQDRGQKGVVLTCKDHLIGYYQSFGFVHQGVSTSQHGGAIWNDMLLEFERMNK